MTNPYEPPKVDPHSLVQEAPPDAARDGTVLAELVAGWAATLFLAGGGALFGVLALSPLFAHWMRPSPPLHPCGMWWLIPFSTSILVGGSAGIALGLYAVCWYEAIHYPGQKLRIAGVVLGVALMVFVSLVMCVGCTLL
jgi:hypothetical protein